MPVARGWFSPLITLATTTVIVGGVVIGLQTMVKAPREFADVSVEGVTRFMEGLRSSTINTTFADYATRVEGTTRLQVAQVERLEMIAREDAASVWGFKLPDVMVEARYPATYTYYLELNGDDWRFDLQGDTLLVYAPSIQANLPANDISSLELHTLKTSILRNEAKVREDLKREITGYGKMRAEEIKPLAREAGRRSVEQFIQRWLLTMPGVVGATPAAPVRSVRVFFPEERFASAREVAGPGRGWPSEASSVDR